MSGFSRSFHLSARQETVLRLLIDGVSMKQIAVELSVSQVTTRRHAEELYRKCGARNQREFLALLTRTLIQELVYISGSRLPYSERPDAG